jgi:hypothetical protein
MSLTVKTKNVSSVVVELDGGVIATVEVPKRNALKYVLDHPRSKYTAELKRQMLAQGCAPEQVSFILGLQAEDSDEAEDKTLDNEDREDGSNYMDDPRYLTQPL